MTNRSTLMFSAVGHAYFHMLTAYYFVIVLALEETWQLPYHRLIELWTPGALAVGVFALVAGWLGDRWSARGMLVIYFIGMGLSSVAAGYAANPTTLMVALFGVGLFASIYHPVGIPLVIRSSSSRRGMALALNGAFGSLGAAMAGLVTGLLLDLGGSWLAFVLPGAVVTLTGVAMALGGRQGESGPEEGGQRKAPDRGTGGWRMPFVILLFCLTAAGLIYHTVQTAMPKSFAVRIGGAEGIDATTVGLYVALAYGVSGVFQFVGGALADRFELKRVYLYQYALHTLVLVVAAYTFGFPLVILLCLSAALSSGALPAENMLLARHTPAKHHGLVFGLKFVLFFGSGPLGIVIVSTIHGRTGSFEGVFLALAVIAALVVLAAARLPARQDNKPIRERIAA